jgi:tripartite-type tricarboxylate transporter receptor subunit TctC
MRAGRQDRTWAWRHDRRRALLFGLWCVAAATPALPRAYAQAVYPKHAIKLVIPFSPGGLTDLVGRSWADKVKPLLGPVVVEHQPGAGGSLGAMAVARSQPDGHTILLASASQFLIPAVQRGPYDPLKDFIPIAIVARVGLVVAVHPSVPAQTLQELLGYARANPGKLSYGTGGVGSTGHLAGELLKSFAATPDIVHIPYKGAGQMITDLISGHVPMLMINMSGQLRDLHQSGQLRMLAVTTSDRIKIVPDVPTAIEAGVPGMVFDNFTALFAPAGTPQAIVDRIAQATRAVMTDVEFREKLMRSGFEPHLDSTPEAARQFVEDQIFRWTATVRDLRLKLD